MNPYACNTTQLKKSNITNGIIFPCVPFPDSINIFFMIIK